MSKAVAGREATNEANIARRIAMEREQRGWSYDVLAKRVTAAGCVIQGASLFKIEKQGRRITVEELIALAHVFEVTIDNMLMPVEVIRDAAQARSMESYVNELKALGTAVGATMSALATVVVGPRLAEGNLADLVGAIRLPVPDAVALAAVRLREDGWELDDEASSAVEDAIKAFVDSGIRFTAAYLAAELAHRSEHPGSGRTRS